MKVSTLLAVVVAWAGLCFLAWLGLSAVVSFVELEFVSATSTPIGRAVTAVLWFGLAVSAFKALVNWDED